MNTHKETEKCSFGSTLGEHCSGCADTRSEGTHQGCTIEHGHIGCDKDLRRTTQMKEIDHKQLNVEITTKATPPEVKEADRGELGRTEILARAAYAEAFKKRYKGILSSDGAESAAQWHWDFFAPFIRTVEAQALEKGKQEALAEEERTFAFARNLGRIDGKRERDAELREKIEETGEQQDDDSVWCNMDEVLALLTPPPETSK